MPQVGLPSSIWWSIWDCQLMPWTYSRCFAGSKPNEWVKWLSLAEWWYNTNTHPSTGLTPYEVVYGVPPPCLLTYVAGTTRVQVVEDELKSKDQIMQLLKEHLMAAQERMKRMADPHRTEREFSVGDWVYLNFNHTANYLFPWESKKLSPKYFGPFQVIARVGPIAYKLQLLSEARIHPVFHVSSQKKKVGNGVPVQSRLPPILDQGVLQHKPERILAKHMVKLWKRAVTEILVQWQGCDESDATWEGYYKLKERFPDLDLEDKVFWRGKECSEHGWIMGWMRIGLVCLWSLLVG